MSLTRISRHLFAFEIALALALLVDNATAADESGTSHSAEAQRLFDDALALLDQNQAEKACPKLEKSNQLDPGVGTQFQLADCYERIGKLATAHRLFSDVAMRCAALRASEHEQLAIERKARLEPRLQYLAVQLASSGTEIELTVDDSPIPRDVWSRPFPIDAGVHRFRVNLRGGDALSGTVSIPAGERLTKLTIGRLPEPSSRPMRAQVTEPRGIVNLSSEPGRLGTYRTVGYVTTGVGAVGLVLGGVYGLIAISKRANSETACYAQNGSQLCTSTEATALHNEAVNAGNWSTAFFVGGGVVAAAGIALLFSLPRHNQSPIGVGVGIAPQGGFARLGGEF